MDANLLEEIRIFVTSQCSKLVLARAVKFYYYMHVRLAPCNYRFCIALGPETNFD